MAINYGIEKLAKAVDILATSTSDWRDRLYSAYLCFHSVQAQDDLPAGLQQRFLDLLDAITHVEAKRDEGSVKATLAQMDEEEGRRVMEEIYAIYESLRESERE